MDWFLELVRDVDFRDRIGLVAIDECHLVSTWASFREAYAKVFTLRANLLPSVVWFGCTATLLSGREESSGVQGAALDMAAGMYDCGWIPMLFVLTIICRSSAY